MTIDDMLRKMAAGAELKSQLDDGVTSYWFRSRPPASAFVDEEVTQEDAAALIESGCVARIELETDGDMVWFEGYEISDAGRKRLEQAIENLDSAPGVQPDLGDDLQDPPSSKM